MKILWTGILCCLAGLLHAVSTRLPVDTAQPRATLQSFTAEVGGYLSLTIPVSEDGRPCRSLVTGDVLVFQYNTNRLVSSSWRVHQSSSVNTNTGAFLLEAGPLGPPGNHTYEVYLSKDGKLYPFGTGYLQIEDTTGAGVIASYNYQFPFNTDLILQSGSNQFLRVSDGELISVASSNYVDVVRSQLLFSNQETRAWAFIALTNWQASVNALTNGAALGETALQPSWAETGTVFRAIEVIGAQSTLIETAWQNPAAAADWTWTSNGREITLTGYSGPNAVVIPDMLDGLPVTGFGGIFTGNTDITSVGGGANVKAVGDFAFESCWALNSVSLPACTTVGNGAFAGCGALNSVSLPACTTVGTYAFAGCGALISVPLYACTTVGNYAFSACVALNSVTFGQNAPAPAANVFEYSTPTIYVSNPHASGWGDTWNGRPVVRAASMVDIASHNASGTAHADIRALIPTLPDNPNIYTPVYAATTTIAVNSTQAVYKATFGTAGTVTQSIAGLTVSDTQEARWELWLNATNPAALSPTWQGNLDWQGGTPELTVTGRYKFAMSTTGTRITGRQTYPTVYPWFRGITDSAQFFLSAATNATAPIARGIVDELTYIRVGLKNGSTGRSYVVFTEAYSKLNQTTRVTITNLIGESATTVWKDMIDKFTMADLNYNMGSTSLALWHIGKTGTGDTGAPKPIVYTRPANELETAAYNAGWRP